MTHYDVVVIGAGSGNMVLGREFADRRVAICHDGPFGGTCLNRGCIPTKMLVHPADLIRHADDGPRLGARTSADGVDWTAIRDRVFARLDHDAAAAEQARRDQADVDVVDGRVRFVGERRLRTAAGDEITADQIVIATGSAALVPDLPGLDEVEHHTSDTIMRIDRLPRRLGIVGGGYIGAEFAHVFSAYGSEVTQVHYGSALLERVDEEVSRAYTAAVQRLWPVRLDTAVERVEGTGDAIRLHCDRGEPVEIDVLLMATGRRPDTDDLGLDEAGVERHEDGRVRTDQYLRTTAEGVWALGDATDDHMLKHVANHEARVVRHNLSHPDRLQEVDHHAVPQAVFTHPAVATVGLTEAQARSGGLDVVTARAEYADVAYGWAMEDQEHFVKLVGDRATGLLVGAHVFGPEASILVHSLTQAIAWRRPVEGLARSSYWIHPALTEVVEIALLNLERNLVHG